MILKVGSRGREVEMLQEKLGMRVTGIFGEETRTNLIAWQRRNSLLPDGAAGPNTLSRMGLNFNTTTSTTTIRTNSINLNKLRRIIRQEVLDELSTIMDRFGITTPLRLAHFLAQCGHESGGFRLVVENLNYSADGLRRIFPRHFPGDLANQYARQPERIGSRAYANRMGNGAESTGDGFRFRGRGYIQLTGKNNYQQFGKFIGQDVVSNPDIVATRYPLTSAAYFFQVNNLWTLCDRGATDADVTAVTKRVNGGTIGLADRIKHFKEYHSLLIS